MTILDIQLSVQGGAAKLPALLAAVSAFQASEFRREIQVTRLAGTSAGAIVAALYVVQDPPLAMMCDAIAEKHGPAIPKWFPPKSLRSSLWNVWRGKTLYEQKHLVEILKDYVPQSLVFKDLKRPLYILTSDLQSRRSKVFSREKTPEESVLGAVLASAALPYAFVSHRSFGSDMQPVLVDGGICDNLPVAPLVSNDGEAKFGKVFAISFAPCEVDRPTSATDLLERLIDTAVNSAVAVSKDLVGDEYVFPTKTSLRSGDFHKVAPALRPDSDQFARVTAEAALWLNAHVKSASTEPVGSRVVSTAIAPSSDAVMSQAYRAYLALRKRFPYSIRKVTMTLTADSLWPRTDPRFREFDRLHQETHISASRSLVVYGSSLGELDGRQTNVLTMEAYSQEQKPLRLELVKALRPVPRADGSEGHSPYVVGFFADSDAHGDTKEATVRKTLYVRNALNYLSAGRQSDYVTLQFPEDAEEGASEVLLKIRLPRVLGSFTADNTTEEEAKAENLGNVVDGRCVDHAVFAPQDLSEAEGYSILVWRAEDVQRGRSVSVAIRRIK